MSGDREVRGIDLFDREGQIVRRVMVPVDLVPQVINVGARTFVLDTGRYVEASSVWNCQ